MRDLMSSLSENKKCGTFKLAYECPTCSCLALNVDFSVYDTLNVPCRRRA